MVWPAWGQSFGESFAAANKLRNEGKTEAALASFRSLADRVAVAPDSENASEWIYSLTVEVMVGICLQEAGRWQESAEYLAEVLLHENDLALSHWCHLHAIQGENYLKGGLLKLAEPHVKQAKALAERALQDGMQRKAAGEPFFVNRTGYSEALLSMAKYVLATEHYAPAEQILRELLEVEFPDGKSIRPAARGSALHLLGLAKYQAVFEEGAEAEAAEEVFREALALGESLLPRDRMGCLVRLSHLAIEKGQYDQASSWLDQVDHEGLLTSAAPLERTWYSALRNRVARESSQSTHPDFSGDWVALLDHLRSIERASGVGYFRYASAKDIGFEAMQQALTQGGGEEALATLIQFQNIGFLANRLGSVAPSVPEVRSTLHPGEVCVVFFAGKGRWIAFGLGREGPVRHWSGPRTFELQEEIRRLSRTVLGETEGRASSSSEMAWNELARSVRDRLFPKEIQDWLIEQQSIRFVSRATLKNPMFEVLPIGGQAMGLGFAITDWPSIPTGWHLAQHSEGSASDVRPELDWLLLTSTEWSQEARSLDPVSESPDIAFPTGERVRVLRGAKASVSQWQKTPRSQVVQWLTHGLQQEDPEWATSLVITPDSLVPSGLLDGRALLGLPDLSIPPLCILSVCRGDGGYGLEGDPAAGHLAGVLIAKGAHAVVTSRSDASVSLHPTAAFQRVVRAALAEGDRLDQAALRARKHLAQSAAYSAPKHWAAWQVFGNGALQLSLSPEVAQDLRGHGGSYWMVLWGLAGMALVWATLRKLR